MSDLAPFVAAVLRDKVIVDLHEETAKLQATEYDRMTVEITGEEGTPVYAKCQFDKDGKVNAGNESIWTVKFVGVTNIPLSQLGTNLQVRLGGVCIAQLGNENSSSIFGDGEDGTWVYFHITGGAELWIDLVVHGWPSHAHPDGDDIGIDELKQYLSTQVATAFPEATAEILNVNFNSSSVNGLLEGVLRDREAQDNKKQKHEIARRLELVCGGDSDRSAFAARVDDVCWALRSQFDVPGIDGDFEKFADLMIKMKMDAERGLASWRDVWERNDDEWEASMNLLICSKGG